MAYRCLNCGHIFEEGEQARWSESRGEFWGTECFEEMDGCPLCGDSYEETTPCDICGSEHLTNELFGGVCEECINEYKHKASDCYKLGAAEKNSVNINSFLLSLFDEDKIEAILWHHLLAVHGGDESKIDCTAFIEEDKDWFGEQISQRAEVI